MDAAIVHLKSGIGVENVIRKLRDDGTDGIVFGNANAVVSTDTAMKVGRTSDRTEGTIVSITHPTSGNASEGTPSRTNQILIRPAAGTTLFQDRGDSGAALVNDSNEMIGLMWGAYLSPGTTLYGHSIACPIAPVLLAFNISIPTGGLATSTAPAHLPPDIQLIPGQPEASRLVTDLQVRLAEGEQGRRLLEMIDTHRHEVLNLINHKRPVTVTWHRKQGPAFLAAIGRSVKEPTYRIPEEIEGISRQHAIMSMVTILEEHGSEQLRASIREMSLPLLEILSRFDTVDDFVNALEERILPELLEVAG